MADAFDPTKCPGLSPPLEKITEIVVNCSISDVPVLDLNSDVAAFPITPPSTSNPSSLECRVCLYETEDVAAHDYNADVFFSNGQEFSRLTGHIPGGHVVNKAQDPADNDCRKIEFDKCFNGSVVGGAVPPFDIEISESIEVMTEYVPVVVQITGIDADHGAVYTGRIVGGYALDVTTDVPGTNLTMPQGMEELFNCDVIVYNLKEDTLSTHFLQEGYYNGVIVRGPNCVNCPGKRIVAVDERFWPFKGEIQAVGGQPFEYTVVAKAEDGSDLWGQTGAAPQLTATEAKQIKGLEALTNYAVYVYYDLKAKTFHFDAGIPAPPADVDTVDYVIGYFGGNLNVEDIGDCETAGP